MVSTENNSSERVKHADLLQRRELRVLHTLGNSGVQPPRSAPLHVVLSQVRVLRTLEEVNSVSDRRPNRQHGKRLLCIAAAPFVNLDY